MLYKCKFWEQVQPVILYMRFSTRISRFWYSVFIVFVADNNKFVIKIPDKTLKYHYTIKYIGMCLISSNQTGVVPYLLKWNNPYQAIMIELSPLVLRICQLSSWGHNLFIEALNYHFLESITPHNMRYHIMKIDF